MHVEIINDIIVRDQRILKDWDDERFHSKKVQVEEIFMFVFCFQESNKIYFFSLFHFL